MANQEHICECDPVGNIDIADRLGLAPQTINLYNHKGQLPEPRWYVSGSPVWCWNEDIVPWSASRRGPGRPRKEETA